MKNTRLADSKNGGISKLPGTLSPLFPIQDEEAAKRYVSEKVRPIFDKVLNEAAQNHMLVGGVGKKQSDFVYYCPHNFRVYFDFDKTTFNPDQGGWLGLVVKTNGEYIYKNFRELGNVRVKKNQIEITNLIEHKRFYSVPFVTNGDAVQKIVQKKIDECKNILAMFIKDMGGNSSFKVLNFYSEDKLAGEDKIDLLPKKMKFVNEVGKKVYNEWNFEFNNPVNMSNYISSRALENVAPEIASRLDQIQASITPPLSRLKREIKSMQDVLRFQFDIRLLNESEKLELSNYLFDVLSVKA